MIETIYGIEIERLSFEEFAVGNKG